MAQPLNIRIAFLCAVKGVRSAQYRLRQIDPSSMESRIRAEIAAQEKLLRNKVAYKLTLPEIKQTQSALKSYRKQLEDLLKTGG